MRNNDVHHADSLLFADTTTTYILTRCPPGATNCPVGNIPITKTIPVGTTVLTNTEVLPTGKQTSTDKDASPTPTVTGGNDNKDLKTPRYTVISVPTTIHTIMNGVSAQILTVIPVTSVLPAGGKASPSDPPFDANAWQPAGAGNQTTVKGPSSSRLPVVTAGAPGVGSSDGVRVAFLVFVLAWFF